MTYFNVFLRILRLGEKYAYFTVFYNGLNVRNNYATVQWSSSSDCHALEAKFAIYMIVSCCELFS